MVKLKLKWLKIAIIDIKVSIIEAWWVNADESTVGCQLLSSTDCSMTFCIVSILE